MVTRGFAHTLSVVTVSAIAGGGADMTAMNRLPSNERPEGLDVNLTVPLPKRSDRTSWAGCCRFPDTESGSVTRV